MSAERLFSLASLVAMLSWITLILFPRKRWASTIVPTAIPVAIAVLYIALIASSMPGSDGNFSTLAGVRALFANDFALLAGWVHYLAFDLFIGGWEVRDAQRRGVNHLLVIPCLVLTFLFGPAGLLLYLVLRSRAGKKQPDAVFE